MRLVDKILVAVTAIVLGFLAREIFKNNKENNG